MDTQKVTQEQTQDALKKYGTFIYTNAYMFTEDDYKAAKVREHVIWDVPIILSKPDEPGNSHPFQIAQLVRSKSIALLKESPLFNQWELWKQEPYYFCFLDPLRPAYHKEILWYRFYRDIPMSEVMQQFNISSDNARQLIEDMFSEIKDWSNALMEDVLEIRPDSRLYQH